MINCPERARAISGLLALFLALVILTGPMLNMNFVRASPMGQDYAYSAQDILVSLLSSENSNETYLTGFSGVQGVAIGDLNNDGLNEIAVSEGLAGRVTVCKSNGTIEKQLTGLENPLGVAIGDFNNDGLNELAIAETNGSRVTVCKSDGTIVKQFTGLNQPAGVAIGDFDNDHLNEIAIAETGGGRVIVCKSNGTIVKQFTGLNQPAGVAIGDFDNDHLNEIAIADSGSNKVYVIRSDGATIVHQWNGLSQPTGVAIGDYDNSGLNEIAITEPYLVGNVTVYRSDGTTIVGNWTGRDNPTGVAIGDLSNDGKNELVFTEVSKLTVESIPSALAPTYNVSFTESGLPTGVEWWVNLGGDNHSSTSKVIDFFLPNGTYNYSAGASNYASSQSTGQVTVNGEDMNEQVTFTIIPEFPSPFILFAFTIAILLATTIIRKRKIAKLHGRSGLLHKKLIIVRCRKQTVTTKRI